MPRPSSSGNSSSFNTLIAISMALSMAAMAALFWGFAFAPPGSRAVAITVGAALLVVDAVVVVRAVLRRSRSDEA